MNLIKTIKMSSKSKTFSKNLNYFVRYRREFEYEISLIKHAKPNQEEGFVCCNREFVITVIVITEFDCILFRPF